MRIEQLKALKRISETNSVNRAAQSLFLSHQALSASVQSLERELNTVLLNRSKTGVSLTEDGFFVLEEGEKILEAHESIQARFLKRSLSSADISSALNISCTGLAQTYYLAKPISYFYKTFPQITIQTNILSCDDAIAGVQHDSLDFAFISEFSLNNRSSLQLPEGIHYIPLETSDVSIMCSRYSTLAPYQRVSLQQLLDQSFVYNQNYSSDMTDFFFTDYEKIPDVLFVSSESQFLQMIADNNAISFFVNFHMPTSAWNPIRPEILVKPLLHSAQMSIGYICKKENFLENPLCNIFINHLF